MKLLSITAVLIATASAVSPGPSVEVMHFWTSGGEGAATDAITAFFTSDQSPEGAGIALADAIAAAK